MVVAGRETFQSGMLLQNHFFLERVLDFLTALFLAIINSNVRLQLG